MDRKTNLRNMTITPDQGKDVRESSTLGGQAKKTPGQSAKNELKQYTTGKPPRGAVGGEASYS
jgi:hypothetical protein